jgi:2'-hydroxyisoflavone reductase
MKLLIIGGTRFVGRHLVDAALARGHEITLFTRGQSNPDLFPEVEHLHGDRSADLSALDDRRWDAVVDTCGYVPRHVRMAAEKLANAVDHYTFISTVSVYEDPMPAESDETAKLKTLADETVEEVTGETYGGLKVLCERAAEEAMPGRVLTIRPGMIVGPYDPTDRFPYWTDRVAQGGEVLVPGKPERRVQAIDARDMGLWNVKMIEAGKTGIYNAVGPDYALTWGEWMDTCKVVSGSDAQFTWVSDEFISENQQESASITFTPFPFWVPEPYDGIFAASNARAIRDGLTFRPLADIVRDTQAWFSTLPADRARRAGPTREQEAQLLALWREKAQQA